MNITRHEKLERLAETGRNLSDNAFSSNAERIMSALESENCDKLDIAFTVTIRATNKDKDGIGKFVFENAALVVTNNQKFKDSFDDVLLNFVDEELNNMDKAMEDAKKKEKSVKGAVIPESRQLTTSVERQELVYRDEKKDKTYYAGQGLGDNAFMTFKGLPTDGARHRFVNKALPVRETIEEAEADLIAYALKKGWKRVEQESEKQGDNDTMKVKQDLTETFEDGCAAGKTDTGCCFCENDNCGLRQINMGDAVKCELSKACSKECPRLIKDESNFELKPEESTREFTPVNAELDNAEKLARLGLSAIKLIPEEKTIKAYDKEEFVFVPSLTSPYKTKEAAERDFDKLLTTNSNFQDIDAFSDWDVDRNKVKFFRGYEHDLQIRYQTKNGGWGSPEKFNTEAQYENRLDELRRKMDHFEA